MAFPIANFSLTGDFDPDDITRQLEMEPSVCTRAGEIEPATGGTRIGGSWLLMGSDDDGGDVADQLITLVGKLDPKAHVVARLATEHKGYFDVFASLDPSYHGFFLSSDIITSLALLKVGIECTYVRPEEFVQVRGGEGPVSA